MLPFEKTSVFLNSNEKRWGEEDIIQYSIPRGGETGNCRIDVMCDGMVNTLVFHVYICISESHREREREELTILHS